MGHYFCPYLQHNVYRQNAILGQYKANFSQSVVFSNRCSNETTSFVSIVIKHSRFPFAVELCLQYIKLTNKSANFHLFYLKLHKRAVAQRNAFRKFIVSQTLNRAFRRVFSPKVLLSSPELSFLIAKNCDVAGKSGLTTIIPLELLSPLASNWKVFFVRDFPRYEGKYS